MQPKLSSTRWGTALQDTDEDPNNPSNVILLYSGASQAKSTNGGGVDDWNREHVWAKSHGDFGTSTGPGTDVHHLRPTDVSVNSTRGNKDFDTGGSPVAQAPGSLTDADSFEPRDADKGDVARMIFYMSVRYEGGDGFADLEADDAVSSGTAPRHGGSRCCCSGTSRTRPARSSSAATSGSTRAGRATGTRSSTTRSGRTSIWG